MSDFDPYYKWLAIPPAEQPPHHYRLLGLALYEPDLEVISAAADRQMAHIRSYQNSAHSAASQKLLNELSHARLVLLRPDTKASYDAELQRRLSSPLPRARPLKMATALEAPVSHGPEMAVLPQPQPLARPAPGLIRPQTLPAANRPPVRSEAHLPNSASPTNTPTAYDQGEASPQERRRAKQRSAMTRSLIGVVLGGIAGTYIAGIILNFLGAPLPDGVRFLPGLGKKVAVANNPRTDDRDNPSGAKNTPNSHNASANTTPSGTPSDPWQGVSLHPLTLGPGVHTLSFLEEKGRHYLQVKSAYGGTNNHARHPIGVVTRLSGAEVSTSGNRLKVSAKPGGFATFVMPLRAATNCAIASANVKFTVDVGEKEDSSAYGMVSRDFDFATWDKPKNTVVEFPLVESQSFAQCVEIGNNFTANNDRELFFVIALNVGDDARPGATGIQLSQPALRRDASLGTVTVRSNDAAAPAEIVVVPRPASGESAEKVIIVPNSSFGAAQYQKPAQLSSLLDQARQQLTSEDPRDALLAASRAGSMDMTCALLLVSAQQAVDCGDVVLAATAFQRLNRAFGPNFVAEEAKALDEIYDSSSPGFQPAMFAAWSVGLLERLNPTQRAPYATLARRAYAAAVESGDRDLIQRATLQVAGDSP